MVIRVPDQRNTPGGYSALDDRLLVLDFQAGNPQAFVEIHRRYGALARRVCQRFLPNPLDSEEALQETMIRVFQGLYRFNGRYALKPWIARIAKNVSLDILRGHARRPQTDHSAPASDELPVPGDEADEIVERLVQRDTVLAVLADLPETHRRALMLRELEGRSHREVAQEMEITPSQAKALIHRAKGSFRRRWLEKVADRGGFMVVAFVPLLWLVRLGSFLRRIGERAGHAAQAAQVAVPEAMTSTVTASAAPSASTVAERLVAAGMTVLLAGGLTVGAAKIVTDRGDEHADRAAVTAPATAVTKQRVKQPSEDAPVRAEDRGFGDNTIKAEPPLVVESTTSAVAESTSPPPASAAVTCNMSADQTLTVNVGAGGSIALSETAGTIVVNPDGGAADCVGNLVAKVSTVAVNGDSGNESVSIGGAFTGIGTVKVSAGDGDDTVNGGTYGGVLVANGDAGADTLIGGSGADTLNPGTGDDSDTVNCGAGIDTVSYADVTAALAIGLAITGAQDTGAGSDTITNCENLTGGSGGDTLTGSAGDDAISGGPGNDAIVGGGGNDILGGDEGEDTLWGEDGDDTIDGGAGTDTASYSTTSQAVTVSLAVIAAQDTVGAGNDTIANTENLTGGKGGDTLTGSAGADTIDGGDGNDTIDGGDGHDILGGDGGDDTIRGEDGDDTIDGGAGTDTASYSTTSRAVSVSLGITTTQDTVGAGNDTIANTENLTGGKGADILAGSAANNVISGGRGSDSIIGNAGADTALMGGGNDMFVWDPGDASDVIEGGSGSDSMVFNGSGGNEVMASTASGGRVLFTRNPGHIVMSLDDVEAIYVRALAGTDRVTVNDMRGTDLGLVDVDLAGDGSTADGQADIVTVVGTGGGDSIGANANGAGVEVGGLAAFLRITNADPALDTLVIDTDARADDVTVDPALAGLILVSVR